MYMTLMCAKVLSATKLITHLGDQVKLLASNGRVTRLERQRYKVESEVPSTEVRDVETCIWRSRVPDLDSCRYSCSGSIESGTYS